MVLPTLACWKDTLLEFPGQNYYELLDLGLAKCQLMVAGRLTSRRSLGADGCNEIRRYGKALLRKARFAG